MAPKKEQPISLKFIILSVAFIIGLLVYLTSPNELKEIQKTKTFEETLEYRNHDYASHSASESIRNRLESEDLESTRQYQKIQQQSQYQRTKQQKEINNTTTYVSNKKQINYQEDENFYKLLDNLKTYTPKSVSSAENIVRKILKYKGYPEYILTIKINESEDLKQKTQGSYIAALFNIQTGEMHINKVPLYQLQTEEVVAIIAHELDHFDKIAQVCKSMGTNAFIKMLNDNNMQNVNYTFWNNAQAKANISNFDSQFYKDALVRYINQGTIDLVSSYSDLYRLSEHMRNPLEISAYEVSDFIFDYYNIETIEGPIKKLVKRFNSLDWTIYNLISKNEILKDERIALFDYFFMQAIANSNSKYQAAYNDCIQNRNGNMSNFWLAFEQDHQSFYNKNSQMDSRTYNNIMYLLDKTEQLAQRGLSTDEICNALKFKVNTLYANLVFPNAVKYMTTAANDYIAFINKNKISKPEDELQMILLLICIENKLFKNNQEEMKNLYYIEIPETLREYYPEPTKSKKFHFIYKNSAFINILNERRRNNPSLTEQTLLGDLLYETRPFENVKY